MKVILLKNVPGLGRRGEVLEVAAGYARNFLLPWKLAEAVSDKRLKEFEREKFRQTEKAEKNLHKVQKIAEKLNQTEVEIFAKAAGSGRLYAAVSRAMIAKKLKEKGLAVSKDEIILDDSLKELGEFPVRISLPDGLEAEITVIIKEQ